MAFHEQHPYLGVFFFLAIFGCLAFLQFYRFGYISAKVRIAASFSPQGSSGLHRRCSAVPLHVCTCACGELRAACCVIRVIFGVFFMSASSGWFDCDPGNGSSCSRMFGGLATVELVACASFIKF